jgi:dTDP-4-amino-4,6-dideoxygalactose transaminase
LDQALNFAKLSNKFAQTEDIRSMNSIPQREVPVLNLKSQYQAMQSQLEYNVLEVLRSGNYILGKNGEKLEADVAAFCGARYGIGVANGTDALILALWCLDIGPGDEVITSAFTFAATVEAIMLRGAKPVFVDINPETYNIDVNQIEAKINPNTKAIIPVHLYGQPSEMDVILGLASRYGLRVIEDNAQAIGATYKGRRTGSIGDLGCISFYPTKNLGTAGDAGMITTNDPVLAERLKAIRAHGMRTRYYHDELGVNSRMDEIHAAILLTKLPYLEKWNTRRQEIADLYTSSLAGCPGIALPKTASSCTNVYHQYTVRVLSNYNLAGNTTPGSQRDYLKNELQKRGVGSMIYYPVPLHQQKAYTDKYQDKYSLPITEEFSAEVLSLPMYPELSNQDIEYVANCIKEVMTGSPFFVAPHVAVEQPAGSQNAPQTTFVPGNNVVSGSNVK